MWNWSRTVLLRPAEYVEPQSEDEVLSIVRRARDKGQKLKAIGSGHSWSSLAITDGVLLNLRRMNAPVVISPSTNTVTVQAGMQICQLLGHLNRAGLCPTIVGSIAKQQLGGIIATGTHGSSLTHGNLSSFVTSMRLITPEGEVLDLAATDERLQAARVHLGALGIVTQVTLQVEPAFLLEEAVECLPVKEAIRDLASLARSAEYVKLWWLPHVEVAQIYRYRRVPKTTPRTYRPLVRRLDEVIINRGVFPSMLALASRFPSLTPRINRLTASAYLGARRTVGLAPEVLSLAMPPIHREMEASVPLSQGGELFERLVHLIDQESLMVNFPVEARFVAKDQNWMSPAFGRDSCQLGAYMAASPDLDAYFAGFARIVKEMGARPHWGKEFTLSPEEVQKIYPEAGRFAELARSLDPRGALRNPALDQILPLDDTKIHLAREDKLPYT